MIFTAMKLDKIPKGVNANRREPRMKLAKETEKEQPVKEENQKRSAWKQSEDSVSRRSKCLYVSKD